MNRALSTFQLFTSNSDSGGPELKIALVALPYEEGPQRIMPLGLQNISAYIKKNIKQKKSIKIFDYSNLESSNTEQLEDLILQQSRMCRYPLGTYNSAIITCKLHFLWRTAHQSRRRRFFN